MAEALPYVYILVHRDTRHFYFGYRESNKNNASDDLGVYQSSSKKVKDMGYASFHAYVVREFETPLEAYDYEQRLIEANFDNPLILNQQYRREGDARFKTPPRLTPEWRSRIRESSYRRSPISEETRDKLRRAKLGKTRGKEDPKRTAKRVSAILDTFDHVWEVTTPNGEVVEVRSLNAYCVENNLGMGHMSSVASGKRKHHKGYSVRKLSSPS